MGILIRTKRIFSLIFFISFCLLFTDCEEEKPAQRDYPRVNTLPVSNITNEGAVFSADIYSLGTEKIKEYGFIWSQNDNKGVGDYRITYPGDNVTTGIYHAHIETALKEGVIYNVKPFIVTDDHVIYGKALTFLSLGGKAPVITGFEPAALEWGDTLIISGKNFSQLPNDNNVYLNQTKCVVVSSTETTLAVIVNKNIIDYSCEISVEIAGNISYFKKGELEMLLPYISNCYPKRATWGDTITLTGNHLDPVRNSFSVAVSGFPGNIIEAKRDTLVFIVPYQLETVTNNMKISINNLALTLSEPFTLLPPYFSISPNVGTWQSPITLTGRFNTIASRNKIYLNDVEATITSVSATKMMVNVPLGIQDTRLAIKYSVAPFNVVTDDSFTILPPVLKSFTPTSGSIGVIVTIKGENFNRSSSSVSFGTLNAQITSRNDSIIVCKVPVGANGHMKVTVKTYGQSSTSADDFLVTSPKITGVYPLEGTFNDEITISGENFVTSTGNTTVSFGGIGAIIVSKTGSTIVAKIPLTMDSIPRTVTVMAGFDSDTSLEKVTLLPPTINTVTPASFIPGQDIVISGNNFNPIAASNVVYWDNYPLTIKSATKNEIIATLPSSLLRGNKPLQIIVGGYKRYSPISYNVSSAWYSIEIPPSVIWTSTNRSNNPYTNDAGIFFSVGGRGYMMDYINVRLTSFDPVSNEFTDLGEHPEFKNRFGSSGVNHLDTFYLAGRDLGFLRYNIEDNNWTKLCDMPTTEANGVLFSIDGEIYFGLTSTDKLNASFWVYDPINKSWKSQSQFPFLTSSYNSVVAYFSDDTYGYVLFKSKQFYKYNPKTDTWSQLASFPFSRESIVRCSYFALNNMFYVGLGHVEYYQESTLDTFWAYDPILETWSLFSRIPGGTRFNAVSFTINNKAYMGLGVKGSTQKRDFYELDPTYILK